MSEIIVLLVPEVMAQEDYYFLSSCISNSRRKKLNRFINKKDAYRSLLAETLVRKVIIDNLDIPNSAIQFGKRKYGKPFLCGQANFHFNISHSGQWVVVIWGGDAVGIDVERVRDVDISVSEHFFSGVEFMDIMSKPESERQGYFCELWTLKESYIKALGTGLSTPLDSFSIRFLDRDKIILSPERDAYQFKQYPIDPEYKLSACTFRCQLPKSVQWCDYRSLLYEMMSHA